ncbi:adenine phosphoribosyltransferase [Streptomyces sp. NPDC046727]|uniref:adenine phosphoribosyltransferase n=1 Tax=Streptomyces sp. NPDC046727 TaxID=3155373 RepID=UPI0033CF3D69
MTTTSRAGRDAVLALLHERIRDVPDHPRPGVVFKDITPLLSDPVAFGGLVDLLADECVRLGATRIVGVEARGFILGAAVAARARVGFVPARKAGKLPGPTLSRGYDLEYGSAVIELKADALDARDRVLVVDDVLATGGTAEAVLDLVRSTGATPAALAVLLELGFLGGRERLGRALAGAELHAVISV